MIPWVVVRCRNDIAWIESTLLGLRQQTRQLRILALDNASSDGSREVCARLADRCIDIAEGHYVPGRILNLAMRETEGPLVAFINSDCTPSDRDWLAQMLQPFDHEQVGAVYGRQMPRPDCFPIFARDTLAMYPDGPAPAWRVAFSMAASAVRRQAWEQFPFDENIRYSEDVEWSLRLLRGQWKVTYQPLARAYHSHNYSLAQWQRRMRGEGSAEAVMFPGDSTLRYAILPLLPQVFRDLLYCFARREWKWCLWSPVYRVLGARARLQGYRCGR